MILDIVSFMSMLVSMNVKMNLRIQARDRVSSTMSTVAEKRSKIKEDTKHIFVTICFLSSFFLIDLLISLIYKILPSSKHHQMNLLSPSLYVTSSPTPYFALPQISTTPIKSIYLTFRSPPRNKLLRRTPNLIDPFHFSTNIQTVPQHALHTLSISITADFSLVAFPPSSSRRCCWRDIDDAPLEVSIGEVSKGYVFVVDLLEGSEGEVELGERAYGEFVGAGCVGV